MNNNISLKHIFSDKNMREGLEIGMFLKYYNSTNKTDYIVFQKREKPDYFIKNSSNAILGVELSSVYKDDQVVATEHKSDCIEDEISNIPCDPKTHQIVRNSYFKRVFDKINEKRAKVKSGEYDITYPLILSLYLNDYYIIHIDKLEWAKLVEINRSYFSQVNEFKQIILIGIRSADLFIISCS